MKLTNKQGLPQPLVEAVRNDSYGRGDADISVTQLLAPPRQVALIHEHADEIEEDAADRIYSLLGQAVHTILERANKTGIAERRLSITCEGWKISGGMDAYYTDTGLLQDYKVSTAYAFKGGRAKPEHEAQLNVYAEILRQHGEKVQALAIVGILRDFSKLEAARDPEYPQSQVVVIPVPLWTQEHTQKYVRERVLLHQAARKELPLCSAEDRWAKPDIYAVMKQGKDRAEKLYESERDAQEHAASKPGLYVVKRPGVSTRCSYYCGASKFCTQFQLINGVKETA